MDKEDDMQIAPLDQIRGLAEHEDATAGVHLLADLWGCEPSILTDRSFLKELAIEAARRAGATVCEVAAVNFPPRTPLSRAGVTVVAVLAESHLSIHTYPETGYVAVDIFTCGSTCDTYKGYAHVKEKLSPARDSVTAIVRGDPERSLSAKP
jgi:S-adenosylmethionine decarboxylase